MMMMSKRCIHYVGVACVDGSCPMAKAEEYEERCMDVVTNCNECHYYEGCDDCYFYGTDYCEDYQEGLKLDGENKL